MKAWRQRCAAMATALALGLVMSGCNPDSTGSDGSALTPDGLVSHIDAGSFGNGTDPQRNFNPFSPNKDATDYTYEPLYLTNTYSCGETPWLATSYTWRDPEQLVFTLRKGVTWQDGRPFTAADVVFTYRLLKRFPALDTNGVWTSLKKVTADGDRVVFDFDQPSATMFSTLGKVVIVPEHIWAKVKDPTTFTNPDPIGTGPYGLRSFNSERMVLERDPHYWQAAKVRVKELWFTRAPTGGEVDQLRLVRGQYDFNLMFVPQIDKTYVARDPADNHYWFPPGGVISLFMNLTHKPFDDTAFRRALVYAFDRQAIADKAEYGYVKTASQTGLLLPNQQDLVAPGVKDDGRMPYDPARAARMLTAAGYRTDGAGHRLGKDGKPLHFVFEVPAGWTDWIQAAQIMREGFQRLGIGIDVRTPSPETVTSDQTLGDFDVLFTVYGGDCNIHTDLAASLSSKLSAPIGKKATSNYARWTDPRSDALLADLQRSTSTASERTAVDGLERIMLDQVPNIPLWYGGKWFEDRTTKVVGWPSANDPYAGISDSLLIVTHLTPKKS